MAENVDSIPFEEILRQIVARIGGCNLTLKNGLTVSITKFSTALIEEEIELKGKVKKYLHTFGRGSGGFYLARFNFKPVPAYLMFHQEHLPDVCIALRAGPTPDSCWCYKFIFADSLFCHGSLGWNALWLAINSNLLPNIAALLTEEDHNDQDEV
jgi:hypothetical protein